MAKKIPPTAQTNFVCFNCRIALKQPGSSYWDCNHEERPFECPRCQSKMKRIGKYFKAPPSANLKQWIKVELLLAFGMRFDREECSTANEFETLPMAVDYLSRQGHSQEDIQFRLKMLKQLRSQAT